MEFNPFSFPYAVDPDYSKRIAYFSMEFAIDQALKIYSGGLGFLAGSHMRSAYALKQAMVGIGILWKYGYYDQGRNVDQTMRVDWQEKYYFFLEDTQIKFRIQIHGADVWVKAYYLPPSIFQTAPLFLLTTDLIENDYLAQTITHRLYDTNQATKLAQYMLLGIGGAKLLDEIRYPIDVYHLNEAHGLPVAFYLLDKWKDKEVLKNHLVFTTHTPEEAGNEKHSLALCAEMGYFCGMQPEAARQLTGMSDDLLNLTLAALRLAKRANGVSKIHGTVARKMWEKYGNICPIGSITNAQNAEYWADRPLYEAAEKQDNEAMGQRKQALKTASFLTVADQVGKLFRPDVLTLVWARRFAGYKRADLLLRNLARFEHLVRNNKYPIQIIWAGKPFPADEGSVALFNHLVHLAYLYPNVAVLTGYELGLSKKLKQGADIWLNNPRVPREASGTSGMTAAMNGALNLSTQDGWVPEGIEQNKNGFVVPLADYEHSSLEEQDEQDMQAIYDLLEHHILPLYYEQPAQWWQLVRQSMRDIRTGFDSDRLAREYYDQLYR